MKDNFFYKILEKNNVVLAPMAGITNMSYRYFFRDYHVGLFYTEMVSAMGLVYDSEKTKNYLPLNKDFMARPIGIQLFGPDAKSLTKAIHILESINDGNYYDFIDINLGCSIPKVTRNGSGASLLKNLKKLEEIMREVVKTSSKPISAKIRLGWNENNVDEIVSILERSGVQMVAIHARFAKQLYQGKPHWELIKDIQTRHNIPLVISGDIFTLEDAIKALTITKAMGVMIARGGIGNPYLAKNIFEHYHGDKITKTNYQIQCDLACQYAHLIRLINEHNSYGNLKSVLPKFYFDFPNAKNIRRNIVLSLSIDQIVDAVNRVKYD